MIHIYRFFRGCFCRTLFWQRARTLQEAAVDGHQEHRISSSVCLYAHEEQRMRSSVCAYSHEEQRMPSMRLLSGCKLLQAQAC